MFRSKFKDLNEKNKEALYKFWLEGAFFCHSTLYRIIVNKNDKASLTPMVVMSSQLHICKKAHAEIVSR